MTYDMKLAHLSQWRTDTQAAAGDIAHNNVKLRYEWMATNYGANALDGMKLVENGTYFEFYTREMEDYRDSPSELARFLINKWLTSSGHKASLLDKGNILNGAAVTITRPRKGIYGVYGIHSFTYRPSSK